MNLTQKYATDGHSPWLFELYAELLREPIEAQWGWDDEFQKDCFKKNLPASKFHLYFINSSIAAASYVNNELDHLYIKMLLVPKLYQRQGVGRKVIVQLQEQAIQQHKSIKLSVIKANPVLSFYTELGFEVINVSNDSFHLEYFNKGSI
jgi:ribosomal protein S18 acetylase RimI-like enzyme